MTSPQLPISIAIPFRQLDFQSFPARSGGSETIMGADTLSGPYANKRFTISSTRNPQRLDNVVLDNATFAVDGSNGVYGNVRAGNDSFLHTYSRANAPLNYTVALDNSALYSNGSQGADNYTIALNPNPTAAGSQFSWAQIEGTSGHDTATLTADSKNGLFWYDGTHGVDTYGSKIFNVDGTQNFVVLDQTDTNDGTVSLISGPAKKKSTDIYNIAPGNGNTVFISDPAVNTGSGQTDPTQKDKLNFLGSGWTNQGTVTLNAQMKDDRGNLPPEAYTLQQSGTFTLFENTSGTKVYVQHILDTSRNNLDTNLANFETNLNIDPATVQTEQLLIPLPDKKGYTSSPFPARSGQTILTEGAPITGTYLNKDVRAFDIYNNPLARALDITLQDSNLQFGSYGGANGSVTATNSYIYNTGGNSTNGKPTEPYNLTLNLSNSIYRSGPGSDKNDTYTFNFSLPPDSAKKYNSASTASSAGDDTFNVAGSNGYFQYGGVNAVSKGSNTFNLGGANNTSVINQTDKSGYMGPTTGRDRKTDTYNIEAGQNNITLINDVAAEEPGKKDILNLKGQGWVLDGVKRGVTIANDEQGRSTAPGSSPDYTSQNGVFTVYKNTITGSAVYLQHHTSALGDDNLANFDVTIEPPIPVVTPPAVTPPVQEPPVVVTPPVQEPPVVVTPPVQEPPVVVTPPVQEPPVVVTPPVQEPPAVTPPVQEPPVVVTDPVLPSEEVTPPVLMDSTPPVVPALAPAPAPGEATLSIPLTPDQTAFANNTSLTTLLSSIIDAIGPAIMQRFGIDLKNILFSFKQ